MTMYRIIGGDQKEYGPVTPEQIREWIAQGRISPETQARLEDGGEWKRIVEFPELAELFQPSAAPAPFSGAPGVAAGGFTGTVPRGGVLDIGYCVSQGWALLKTRFSPVFWGVLVYLGIEIVISAISNLPLLKYVISVVNYVLITGPLMGGLYYFLLRNIRGEQASIEDVFAGFRMQYWQLVLTQVAMAFLTAAAVIPGALIGGLPILNMVHHHAVSAPLLVLAVVGSVLAIVPMVYLAVSWMFALPLVIDRRISFWEALELSRRTVGSQWWNAFGLLVVCGLINVLGLIACCVGLLFAIPVSMGALMFAYESLFPREAAT
ncbi:MAG TPA: GYF domain-containing protein [Verrucomicrobiae bacterium]|nr:GYF domain-containing protein [Verrucomicrobiae bacterium]